METLSYYKSIDFWIAPQSSAMELINQTNDNGLIITPENLKYCTQQQCYYIENRIRHDVSFATVSNVDNLTIVNWHDIYEKVERKILYLKTKTKQKVYSKEYICFLVSRRKIKAQKKGLS